MGGINNQRRMNGMDNNDEWQHFTYACDPKKAKMRLWLDGYEIPSWLPRKFTNLYLKIMRIIRPKKHWGG
jgi:hypothetical protein